MPQLHTRSLHQGWVSLWQRPKNEEPDLPYMCFYVALILSTTFVFALYCPQNEETVIFSDISEKIDNILTQFPSASFHNCGDFNIHHKEWIVHSNKTDFEGRYCRDYSIAYELTQIIGEPTCVQTTCHQVNILNLFLTSCPDKCLTKVLPPLGTSVHSLISVQFNAKPMTSCDVPLYRMIFHYLKADWDNFCSYIMEAPLPNFFKYIASKNAALITDWALSRMESFITPTPKKKFQ